MEPAPQKLPLAIELVLLSLWLGAALVFAAVFAPALFAVLPSRSIAGEVVGRVLPVLLYAGIVVAFVSMLFEATAEQTIINTNLRPVGRRYDPNDVVHFAGARRAAKRAGIAGVVVLACAGALQIGQKIDKLRASIGQPIDALSPDDPRRVQFGRLHALSVAILGVAMLAAFALIVSVARRLSHRAAGHPVSQPSLEPSHHG